MLGKLHFSQKIQTSQGLGLAALCIGAALVVLDANVLNVAVPTIRRSLGGGTTALLWIIDAYSLVFAVLLLSSGALGDRKGAKKVFLLGLILFAVSSLVCSFAPNIAILIAGRAAQGGGAALLAPSSLALIVSLYPDKDQRARAVGIWAGVSGIGFAAGPILGGILVGITGWRSVFILNLPVSVLAIWLSRYIPFSPPRIDRFDPIGQLLAAVGLSAVVVALIESSRFGEALTLLVLAMGLVVLAGFWLVEHKIETQGHMAMLPPSLVSPSPMRAGLWAAASYNFGLYGMLIVFSLVLQQQLHYSALKTGLAFLPLTLIGATTSGLLAGRLINRLGSRMVLTLGMALSAIGSIILAQFGPSVSYSYLLAVGGFIVFGSGTGLAAPAMTAAVLSAAPHMNASRASGALNAARQVGGVVGIALLGSIVAANKTQLPVALGIVAVIFAIAAMVTYRWAV